MKRIYLLDSLLPVTARTPARATSTAPPTTFAPALTAVAATETAASVTATTAHPLVETKSASPPTVDAIRIMLSRTLCGAWYHGNVIGTTILIPLGGGGGLYTTGGGTYTGAATT